MQFARVSALVLSGVSLSDGALLRSQSDSEVVATLQSAGLPEIKEKWEKMDDFTEIMFTIACKWKHGKDVNGVVNEKLRDGKITGKEAEELKKETQARNVDFLKASCGGVVAQQKSTCRQKCADRWGEAFGKRDNCDELCVKAYARWETQCHAKAVNLEKVYQMKLTAANSRNQCYEGYCAKYPQVWMRADAAAMNTEVDTQCTKACDAATIKQRCTVKWQLQADFAMANISSACFGEGKVTDCMKTEKATIDTEFTTCKDGDKTCQTQFDECNTKGETDKNFEQAKEFCEQRKKMCQEQVSKDCLNKNRKLLDEAQKKCEGKDDTEFKKCKETKLAEKEKESISKCEADDAPKCDEECHKSCDVTKMEKCLKDLESPNDAGELFCKDFWHLIHETSQLDEHGDPVVA